MTKRIKRSMFAVLLLLLLCALGAQSRGITVIGQEGKILTSFSQSYALVIGESAYTNGWSSLAGVREDVQAVKGLFEEQGFTVELIENADSANLKAGIETFLNHYGYDENIRLIVYYAGHGHTLQLDGMRDMGYIVPTDAPNPAKGERAFQQRAIPMQQFDTWAKMINSRHVLFMFDSCFSGSVFAMSRAAPAIIDYKISQPVRQFIAAGAADETVPDKSIFRRQLEAALRNREADLNSDGYVSGSELGDFLQSTVVNYSNNSQHPQYGKIRDAALDKGDFVFDVSGETAIAPQQVPPVVPPQSMPASPVVPTQSTPALPVMPPQNTATWPFVLPQSTPSPPVMPPQNTPTRPTMFTVKVTYMTQGGTKKTENIIVPASSPSDAEREAEAQFKKTNLRSTFIRAEAALN